MTRAASPSTTRAWRKEVLARQDDIARGRLHPFSAGATPVRDNTGREVIAPGRTLDDAQILRMDWLVEGVQR